MINLVIDVGVRVHRIKVHIHMPKTIFVWDFDWSIVNCNSDEYVPAAYLGDDEVARRIKAEMIENGPTKWHECVANLINACMIEKACSEDDIIGIAANMPFLKDVKQAITDVANNNDHSQAIISDGNDQFIKAFLRENGMIDYFACGIETNVGSWESGNGKITFKISYQSLKYGGHDCKLHCPPNLCKTQVLQHILSTITETYGVGSKRPRVVYIGDGHNDACPAIQVLDENDILLAREGKRCPDPNSLSGPQPDKSHSDASNGKFAILPTLEKVRKKGLATKCSVRSWNTGQELNSLVRDILSEE